MAHPLYPLSARFPQELRPSCFSRCSPISITENFYFFYHQKGTEIGDGHQPEGPAGTVDVIRDVQQQSLSPFFMIAPVSIRVLLRLGLAVLCTIQESPGVVGGPTDS